MTGGRLRPRVLVVAYNMPPDAGVGTLRTLRVVQHLARDGWDATVLTSNPRTYRPSTAVDESLLAQVPAGIRTVRAGSIRWFERLKAGVRTFQRSGNHEPRSHTPDATAETRKPRSRWRSLVDLVDATLAIPDQESGWLLPASFRGAMECLRNRPDVIYSSGPPWTAHLVAGALAAASRRPWVADFRDPWARAPWREDRRVFAAAAARRLERTVVARAASVLFVSHANRDDFARQYGPDTAAKFGVIPNGCNIADFPLSDPLAPALDPFVLLHAGSLYAGRTPMPLFQAISAGVARGSIDRDRFRLRFIGTVSLSSDLNQTIRELGLEDVVEFAPRVPRADSLRAMASASALLLLQPGHAVAVPAKLYEYLAVGRPILAIAEGETVDIIRLSGVGAAVGPHDVGAILDGLKQVMTMAHQRVAPAPASMFDGSARAAETVAVLKAFASVPRDPACLLETPRTDERPEVRL